jgi:hypothetical protein
MRMRLIILSSAAYIFPRYVINGIIFERKYIEHAMCVFVSSRTLAWNNSHAKKNWARSDRKCLHVKYPSLLCDFNETSIFWTHFRTVHINFQENSSSGSQDAPCGRADRQTDRHDESNSRFLQFCERAWRYDSAYCFHVRAKLGL